MVARAEARVAGWGIAAAVVCAWVVAGSMAFAQECFADCWRYTVATIWLGTASATALAGAVWLLVHGYASGTAGASTPAALGAKVGRIVARAPVLVAVASFYLMVFVGPVGALLVAFWNVGAAALLSEGAERLDRQTHSELLSPEALWAAAAAIVAAAAFVAFVAAPAVLG